MGVYTLARGKGSYEGEWRNGKAHGVGKFTGPTGEEVRIGSDISRHKILQHV